KRPTPSPSASPSRGSNEAKRHKRRDEMKPISFGSAAPKDRAIDVGANLLGEWIEEQARKRRATLRDGSILGASALFALIVVPILLRSTGEASRSAAALRAGVTRLDRELEASDLAKKEAQPGLLVG